MNFFISLSLSFSPCDSPKDTVLLYHLATACEGAQLLENLVARLVHMLRTRFNLRPLPARNYPEACQTLTTYLERVASTTRVVVVIDGAERLVSRASAAHASGSGGVGTTGGSNLVPGGAGGGGPHAEPTATGLHWAPRFGNFRNVVYVVGCRDGPTLDALAERGAREIRLGSFDPLERAALVRGMLARHPQVVLRESAVARLAAAAGRTANSASSSVHGSTGGPAGAVAASRSKNTNNGMMSMFGGKSAAPAAPAAAPVGDDDDADQAPPDPLYLRVACAWVRVSRRVVTGRLRDPSADEALIKANAPPVQDEPSAGIHKSIAGRFMGRAGRHITTSGAGSGGSGAGGDPGINKRLGVGGGSYVFFLFCSLLPMGFFV
jgi:hypothetical protein